VEVFGWRIKRSGVEWCGNMRVRLKLFFARETGCAHG
jgi:hypothetical protein